MKTLFLSILLVFSSILIFAQSPCEVDFQADRDSLRQGLYDAERLFEICMEGGEDCEAQDQYVVECYEYLSKKGFQGVEECDLFLAFGERISQYKICDKFLLLIDEESYCKHEKENLLGLYKAMGECSILIGEKEFAVYFLGKYFREHSSVFPFEGIPSGIFSRYIELLAQAQEFSKARFLIKKWQEKYYSLSVEENEGNISLPNSLRGLVYYYERNLEGAIREIEKGISLTNGKKSLNTVVDYLNLVNYYTSIYEDEKAMEYANKAKAMAFELKENAKIGEALFFMGISVFYSTDEVKKSRNYIFESAKYLNILKEIKGEVKVPVSHSQKKIIISMLQMLGVNYLYSYSLDFDSDHLYKAEDYLRRSIDLLHYSIEEEGYSIYHSTTFAECYNSYSEVCEVLFSACGGEHFIESALQYADLFQSISLYKKTNESLLGVSEKLLENRKLLDLELLRLDMEKDKIVKNNRFEDLELIRIEDFIFKASKEKWLVEKDISLNGSKQKSYNIGLQKSEIKLREAVLQKEQALLRIMISPDAVKLYFITKEAIYSKKYWEEMKDSINGAIIEVNKMISEKEKNNASFIKNAYVLYNYLLAPFSDHLTENLLIIPDGELEKLPFELLLTEEVDPSTDFSEMPFLIKKHRITYANSARLHAELRKKKVNPKHKKVFAFAPDYPAVYTMRSDDRMAVTRLDNNDDEVRYINDLLPTDMALDQEATSEYFKKYAEEYSVLHLATHARADWDSEHLSYLVFSDLESPDTGRLYASTLYGMDLNAEMVVLSACETGQGEWKRGEGVMSLARAFSYAGAKSVVSTLWRVSDSQSAELMGRFYEHLAAGKDKDVALQQAKLDYIAAHPGKDSHPYYWAGYRLHGNTDPLVLEESFWKRYWWALGIVGLLGVYQLRGRKPAKAA